MSLIKQVVQKYLNIDTDFNPQPKAIVVNAALTNILKLNQNRLAYTVINVGANNVYIGFDKQVSSINGIFLVANGGSISINYEQDLTLPGEELNGIGDGGASNLYVIEILAT